jgi:hypothetical protein
MLTQEKLKSFINYDPNAGIFTRIGYLDRWNNFVVKNKVLSTLSNEGYLIISIQGKRYKAHRLVFLYMFNTNISDDFEVDHIDGNRGNNKLDNLKLADRCINMKNKSLYSNNTTNVIGVCKSGNRYRARINVDGKRISLGLFDTIEEAAKVRLEFEQKLNYSENHGRKNESKT